MIARAIGLAARILRGLACDRATGAVDRLAAGASRPAIEDGTLPGLQQSLVNRGAAYVKSGIEKWKGEAAKQLGVEGVTTGLKDEIDQEEADEAATEAANAPKTSQPVYHASDADAYAQNYNALMAPSEGRSILG